MSPKEFINYLHGAVDLGGLKEINQTSYLKLAAKLATITPDSSKESAFCTWLQGVLDMVDEPVISTTQFSKILAKMNEVTNNKINVPVTNSPSVFEDFASIPKPTAEDMNAIFDPRTGYPKQNIRC